MTAAQARSALADQLLARYEEAEARRMARIVVEEIFHARMVSSHALLSEEQTGKLDVWTQRLLAGEPLQYVVGNTHFYGLVFRTDARALIPRPETEELVHWILEDHQARTALRVLDIGAGSGCIAVTLKKNRPDWEVWALDISAGALALTEENAMLHQCELQYVQQDILNEDQWPALGKFDVIVSNPPYIPLEEKRLMPPQVLQYEPALALFVPDETPLLFYRVIARFASGALLPGGRLYWELNEFNAGETAQLLEDAGLAHPGIRHDMQGKPRMMTASQTGLS